MKRNILLGAVLVLIALMVFAQPASSQVIRVANPLFTNYGMRLATSDSTGDLAIQLSTTNSTLASINGAWPDSIRVEWWGRGPTRVATTRDSIAVYLRLSYKLANGDYPVAIGTLVDSCKTQETDYYFVPAASWQGHEVLKVRIDGTDPANPAVSKNSSNTNPSRWTAVLARYFHK